MILEKFKQFLRKASISRELMFWLVIITLAVMMIFGAINYILFDSQLNQDIDIRLTEDMSKLEEVLALHIWNLDRESVERASGDQVFVKSLSLLRVFSNFGELIYEIDGIEEGKKYAFKKEIISYDGSEAGVIEIAISKEYIEIAKMGIIRSTLVIIFAVFFAVSVISFFVSRSISRPIKNLTQIAKEIASGNLNVMASVVSKDEIGILGDTFNLMTKELKKEITRREKAAGALRKSEEKYKDLFYNAPIGFHSFGPDKKIIDINQAELDLLGYTREEVVNKKSWDDFISTKDKKKFEKHWESMSKGETVKDLEYLVTRKDGEERYVLLSASPRFDDKGNIISTRGIIFDVTSEKEVEKKEKELDILRNKFIETVSHQLRTPLTSIQWNLETLLAGKVGKLKEEQEDFIRSTYNVEKEIADRLDDLLVVMDIEEGRELISKEVTSIENIASSVMGVYSEKCKIKNIKCTYSPPKEAIPQIMVDFEKIRKVFEYLFSNAINYTNENGKIESKLELIDGVIRFEISDNGIGIPKVEQKHIFSRFFRASNASLMHQNASGLGLSIIKYYIEQHKGEIGFTSEEDKGSTFWFELPVDTEGE